MTNETTATEGTEFKNWKIGLAIFGTLEILLGVFFALTIPLMFLVTFLGRQGQSQSMNFKMMIVGALVYLALAVWFIWMGIGSFKARRWARALILVTSWCWLIQGLMSTVLMMMFLPTMFEQMSKGREIPAVVVAVAEIFIIFIYLVVPGCLVLFYGSKNVKMTCERLDSTIRWTDMCPLPVLAISVISALFACAMLFNGFSVGIIPFFGTILSGVGGRAAVFAIMFVFGYAAWGTYKLKIKAWWATVFITFFLGVSAVLTFMQVGIVQFYEKMNFPPDQIEMMKQVIQPLQIWIAPFAGIWFLAALGYLIYAKKYFPSS